MSKKGPKHIPPPTKEAILEFIQSSGSRVGKREIARAFSIHGSDRVILKRILRELADEGHIERGHKKNLHKAGLLPEFTVIEITGTDSDGELLARPLAWHADSPPPRIFMAPEKKGPALGKGDRALAKLKLVGEREYEGRVVRRIQAAAAKVLGIYQLGPDGGRIVPTDKKERSEFVVAKGDSGGAEPGALVLAEVMPGRHLGLKRAKVCELLGGMDEPRAISLISIHTHGIPFEFTEAALEQAAKSRAATDAGREDLRQIPLVTIDGADARDFDDAVFAKADGEGWHILVAIADVSWYVRPGDALDKCAYERGNSVYFPDRVVPMLPEALSNGWCSLKPDEDRPCMAVHMWIDAKGHKTRHKFVRGLMRSQARLTYTQVQNAMDGMADEATAPLLEGIIKPLYGAYGALKLWREQRGTLELDIPEKQVVIGEDGKVASVTERARFDSHRLIEEFMISANVAAAEELEAKGQPCMYRIHDEPAMDRIEALGEFLRTLDISMAKSGTISADHFNRILRKVEGTAQAHMVNTVVLRSQSQAEYNPENHGHFGLGLQRYAHFTSPIRRYADLLVHRGLISGLSLGKGGLPPEDGERFADMGKHISDTERRAAAAERDAVDRYTTAFLAERVGALFAGRINGVTRFGLFVTLEETGADGLIPIASLPGDYYIHEEAQHRLIGKRTRQTYTLGDELQVMLKEANPVTGGMVFCLVDEEGQAIGGEPGSRRERPFRKGGKRRR